MNIKKKNLENLVVSLLFFLMVLIFRYHFPFWVLLFAFGGVVGTFILELDFLVYLFLKPADALSLQVVPLLNDRKVKEGILLLIQRANEVPTRVFHTYIFQVIFLVVAFYILTSTASAFGSGVVFFAFMHLLKDQLTELSKNSVLSPSWKGILGIDVPHKFQRVWFVGGVVILFYFLFLLIR